MNSIRKIFEQEAKREFDDERERNLALKFVRSSGKKELRGMIRAFIEGDE